KSLRQCQGREFHEDAEGRGRLFDELRNVRGCHRRSSQLHRRGLQHTQTTLSARLLEPRAIRGPLRSANGQNCRLILSSPSSLLKKVFEVSRWATLIQDPSARRTKDSQPSGLGFEYCASHVRFRVFQQTARGALHDGPTVRRAEPYD